MQMPLQEDWDNCDVRYRVGPANRNSSIQLIPNTLKLVFAVSKFPTLILKQYLALQKQSLLQCLTQLYQV